jgi:glycosyltransferase involved in cell wall biosynthesis
MSKNRKIVIFYPEVIGGNGRVGMWVTFYDLIFYANSNFKENVRVIVLTNRGENLNVEIESVGYHFFLLNRLFRKLGKIFPFISNRLNGLFIFLLDSWLQFEIKEPIILVSALTLNQSFAKNKFIGGSNVFIAGNPNDLVIYRMMKDEMVRNSISFSDTYTDLNRLSRYENSFRDVHKIYVLNSFQYSSFVGGFNDVKVVLGYSYFFPCRRRFKEVSVEKFDKLTFCFIGHEFWLKGLYYLIESWSRLPKGLDVDLVILGSGSRFVENILKFNIKKLSNIRFLPANTDPNYLLRSSHVCIVPSIIDAGPRVIAEAMFCGLPVICSDGCGNSNLVIDGFNGFVIQKCDWRLLKEKILFFIENREVVDIMGERAKANVNSALSDDNMKQYSNLFFDELLISSNS